MGHIQLFLQKSFVFCQKKFCHLFIIFFIVSKHLFVPFIHCFCLVFLLRLTFRVCFEEFCSFLYLMCVILHFVLLVVFVASFILSHFVVFVQFVYFLILDRLFACLQLLVFLGILLLLSASSVLHRFCFALLWPFLHNLFCLSSWAI